MIRYADTSLGQIQNAVNKLQDGDGLCLCGPIEIDNTIQIMDRKGIIVTGYDLAIKQKGYRLPALQFTRCEAPIVKGLILDGEPSGYDANVRTDGVGILFNACTSPAVSKVEFANHATAGISTINTPGLTVDDCVFSAPAVPVKDNERFCCGVYSYGFNPDWKIRRCTFTDLAVGGIFYTNQNNVLVQNCTFDRMKGQHGLYFNSSNYAYIYDNTFIDCFGVGVKFQLNTGETNRYKRINIKRNTVSRTSGQGQAGIAVAIAGTPTNPIGWDYVTITDNKVSNCGYGILLDRVSGKAVNNTIDSCQQGIRRLRSPACVVEPNMITACGEPIHIEE